MVAVNGAGCVEQVADQAIGPGVDGGGPPIAAVGRDLETSVTVPKAARQGSEAR